MDVARELHVKKGKRVTTAGTSATNLFYVVRSGAIRNEADNSELGVGDFFGHEELLQEVALTPPTLTTLLFTSLQLSMPHRSPLTMHRSTPSHVTTAHHYKAPQHTPHLTPRRTAAPPRYRTIDYTSQSTPHSTLHGTTPLNPHLTHYTAHTMPHAPRTTHLTPHHQQAIALCLGRCKLSIDEISRVTTSEVVLLTLEAEFFFSLVPRSALGDPPSQSPPPPRAFTPLLKVTPTPCSSPLS